MVIVALADLPKRTVDAEWEGVWKRVHPGPVTVVEIDRFGIEVASDREVPLCVRAEQPR